MSVSVVLPTFNERDNLSAVCCQIEKALEGWRWEIIVVDDDSPDGTWETARLMGSLDARIRCIRRLGRRGLATAVIEGISASNATYVAVMDADMQHDVTLLPRMLQALSAGDADLVVGSRYLEGTGVPGWTAGRHWLSRLATMMTGRRVLERLSDPMSGFFAMPRVVFEAHVRRLSGLGFKVLLDFVHVAPLELKILELPYNFSARVAGASKMSSEVAWQFLLMLLDQRLGRFIPVRFLAYSSVGLLGVGVHYLLLLTFMEGLDLAFLPSQTLATLGTITFNYSLNNRWTYAGHSLRGWSWLRGLGSFTLVCGLGAACNVGIASYLFDHQTGWPLAAAVGILVSAVWNFSVSARYTWNMSNRI
jgi:dolichol-phosphate mannosyltransferase